ncbi:MAG: 50S ribosomal protein L9 [Bryobacterales bacterium]|nr:50S ribosomal protein L9 [Bryobacterales bacterium]MDE0296891.1 50S ribosomal protein L9 [Bryobacterales bacterium]MDE0434491.1 50S ribosomal protein L9 [Bryobacterales bacterium]
MMEVILKQEIRKLGGKGDVVRVANGYARNFLFPKQMALPATAANKKQIEEMRAAADREAARLRGDAAKLAEQLQALTIEITARAGDSDQLFGSVTSRDIAAELETKGYTIDRHKIVLSNPIRMVGEHVVSVHLHRDVNVPLTVNVLAEGREEEEPQEAGAEEGEAVEAAAETAEEPPSEETSAPSDAAEAKEE